MHYHFEGNLSARDCKRHIAHHFETPAGSSQVELVLRFTPARVHGMTNMLTLTLFDPSGFRGAGHRGGSTHHVQIGAESATPGYLPGPLSAGVWVAQLDTHMIMPGAALHYALDITITDEANAAQSPLPSPEPRLANPPQRGPGWYRGDLHSHTNHSDASGRTVADLVQTAREVGLDFVFLTDHNTTSSLAEMASWSAPDLLTAGGLELTTFWGHALCLGAHSWVDWRVRPGSGEMARIAEATYASNQLFIIAHPMSAGDPGCTGCRWRYGDMMPGNARLVEIWNGPWAGDSNNEEALSLWYDWLNQGLRLVATAGSDTHSSRDYGLKPGFSVIFADALTEAALLDGIRAGHLYLSSGPELQLRAHDDSGARHLCGDTLRRPATVALSWANGVAEAQLRLIVNGRLLQQHTVGAQGTLTWAVTPEQADWVVVEMRGSDGVMLAITNPIFFQ